jgi:hypothetical protein
MKKEDLIQQLNECPGNPEIFFVSQKTHVVSGIDELEIQEIKDEETGEVADICITLFENGQPTNLE